jgi:hypothetical protein
VVFVRKKKNKESTLKPLKKGLKRYKKRGCRMKLSQILKIAGPVVGGGALAILVIKSLSAHPVLDVIVAAGVLAYFAGAWLKKAGK